MNCKTVQSRLSAYLDRELGGDELLQMRAHMSVCSDCRSEAEGLRALKALIGGMQCPEPPEDLAERLTANMLRQRYEEPRKTVRFSALMFAGVSACSMAVTLLVLTYSQGHHQDQPTARNNSAAITQDGSFGGDGFGSGPMLSAANFGPR